MFTLTNNQHFIVNNTGKYMIRKQSNVQSITIMIRLVTILRHFFIHVRLFPQQSGLYSMTTHRPSHYIAEISLNVTLNYNKLNQTTLRHLTCQSPPSTVYGSAAARKNVHRVSYDKSPYNNRKI